MELGHLLTPSSHTHPKVSFVVCDVWSVNLDTWTEKSALNVPYYLLLASHCVASLSLAFHLFSLCNSKKEKQPLPQVCGSALSVVKYKQEFAVHRNKESSNSSNSVLPNNFTLCNIQMFMVLFHLLVQ
jgi:hypothetical protein